MTSKILWLTLWTTLAYWLGNVGGCATSPHWDLEKPLSVSPPAHIEGDSTEPSVTTMNRDDWDGPTISAGSGTVYHYPTYFRDLEIPHELAWSEKNRYGVSPEAAWDEPVLDALHAGHASNYAPPNYIHPPMQALKFGLDVVKAPFLMGIDRPWEIRTSP